MPSGRLLTWTPTHSEAAEAYIQSFIDDSRNQDGYSAQVLPSIAGLAIELNATRTRLYSWSEQEETDFADILGRVNRFQESFLINNGLSGHYNPTITKLIPGSTDYVSIAPRPLRR